MSKVISTAQLRELVRLRVRGAPVLTAMQSLVRELGHSEPERGDLADCFGFILTREGERGPLGGRVQEIISRLTSGGIASEEGDPRFIQAKRLWDLGFGRELGVADFGTYLAGLPVIPETLLAPRPSFPLLCLADPRLGLSRSCSLLGIRFGYTNEDEVPYDNRHTTSTNPFWFRFTPPGTNLNRPPGVCRDEFIAGGNYAGTAMTGIMAYTHHPTLIQQGVRVLDLPGSRHRQDGDGAYLKALGSQPELSLHRDESAHKFCGAGGFCRE